MTIGSFNRTKLRFADKLMKHIILGLFILVSNVANAQTVDDILSGSLYFPRNEHLYRARIREITQERPRAERMWA